MVGRGQKPSKVGEAAIPRSGADDRPQRVLHLRLRWHHASEIPHAIVLEGCEVDATSDRASRRHRSRSAGGATVAAVVVWANRSLHGKIDSRNLRIRHHPVLYWAGEGQRRFVRA